MEVLLSARLIVADGVTYHESPGDVGYCGVDHHHDIEESCAGVRQSVQDVGRGSGCGGRRVSGCVLDPQIHSTDRENGVYDLNTGQLLPENQADCAKAPAGRRLV